jgi:hypothetical protein
VETTTGFGLIESWEILRRTRGGRMVSVAVTLSDWLYRAVLRNRCSRSAAIISACASRWSGASTNWRASIAGGSRMARLGRDAVQEIRLGLARRVFRKMIRDMIAADHLPDYRWPRSRATSGNQRSKAIQFKHFVSLP